MAREIDREPPFLLVDDPARWCRTCRGSGGPSYRGEWMHCLDCHGTGAAIHYPGMCGNVCCDHPRAETGA
jgi:hypothetical protein